MTKGTITGRFTRTEPVLQEINPRTKEGKIIRQAFEDRIDHEPVDWTEIERRIAEAQK